MPWTKLVADQSGAIQAPCASGLAERAGRLASQANDRQQRILSYREAVAEAIEQAMELDDGVIVLGEGVACPGYIYDTTRSLVDRFGPGRVIETPIAEAALTGITLGASLGGLRPVLMHMRCDFLLVSMDQIVNHIAHWYQVFGDHTPLVIRAIVARGWGSGAQHSQSFHALFAGFEGLRVVMPYTPYDVKGQFLSAVASPDPVLFIEHRWLYGDRGPVPEEMYLEPLEQAVLRSRGSNLTVAGMSLANRDIGAALEKLRIEGVTADWIDLRSINPLDMETINGSVARTGRLLIVENGPVCCGIGAEIAVRVAAACWGRLRQPVRRIGWPSATVPAGPELERAFYPGVEQVVSAIREMVS
jgi:pyruvate dehydrogenase E1 component beta subunit